MDLIFVAASYFWKQSLTCPPILVHTPKCMSHTLSVSFFLSFSFLFCFFCSNSAVGLTFNSLHPLWIRIHTNLSPQSLECSLPGYASLCQIKVNFDVVIQNTHSTCICCHTLSLCHIGSFLWPHCRRGSSGPQCNKLSSRGTLSAPPSLRVISLWVIPSPQKPHLHHHQLENYPHCF